LNDIVYLCNQKIKSKIDELKQNIDKISSNVYNPDIVLRFGQVDKILKLTQVDFVKPNKSGQKNERLSSTCTESRYKFVKQ